MQSQLISAETRAWMQDYLDKITAKDAGGACADYAEDLVAHFLGESQLAGDYDKQPFLATVGAYLAERDMTIELVDLPTGDDYEAAVVRNRLAGRRGTYEDLRVTLYRVGDRSTRSGCSMPTRARTTPRSTIPGSARAA